MRVTHVITRMIAGGAQENTLSSVLGLLKKPGVAVRLISGPSLGAEGSLESELRDTRDVFSVLPHLVRPISPLNDIRAYRELVHEFTRTPPDIVHTHSGKAGMLGRLAAAKAGVPRIIHTIHGPSFGSFQGTAANTLFRAAERHAGRVTDHFVVVAMAMTKQYLAAGIGTPEQYTCIRSGFDLAPYETTHNDPTLRTQLGLDPDDIVAGVVARLAPLKGHEDLLHVAPQLVEHHPRLKFLLVGDGPLHDSLRARIQAQGLSARFVFSRLIPSHEIARYIGIMDLLVHLSRREGLPRVVAQTLAAGKPVVAFDCDGTPEVCIDGETGFLIPTGDLNLLVSRISQLIENADLREEFGQNGRSLVHSMFPVQRMVNELHDLYKQLLSQPSLSHR